MLAIKKPLLTSISIITLLFCLSSESFAGGSHVTAGIVSTSIVLADTQRTVILIKNIGSGTCYITEEETATTDDFNLGAGETYLATERHAKPQINGITNTGTTILSVWERKE